MIKINKFNSNESSYLNTFNINYILIQMEDRILFKMNNNEVIISNDSIKGLLYEKKYSHYFVKAVLLENNMEIYILFKNIEMITPQTEDTVLVKMLNGESFVIIADIDRFIKYESQ